MIKYGTISEERPDLVPLLLRPSDSDIYHIGSAVKLDWICPNCGNIIKQKALNKVVSRGLRCGICNDKSSRPEKIVNSIFRQSGIQVDRQAVFSWSGKYRYDFFLQEYNAIVEVHGSQHYSFGFKGLTGVSLEDQRRIDSIKYDLAILNGIDRYIVIDARDVSAKYIVDNALQELKSAGIDAVADISICEKDAMTSNISSAAAMWNSGVWTGEIAKALGVGYNTVIKYLESATNAGLCDYSPLLSMRMSQENAIKHIRKEVRCKQTGEVFESLAEACRKYNITSASNIIRSCNNPQQHAGKCDGVLLSWEYV